MNSLTAAAIGTAVAAVSSPFLLDLLKRLKSRQTISEHVAEHAHKQGTPTMGGLMILVAALVTIALDWRSEYMPFVILLLGFGAIGFVDDFVVPRLMAGKRGLGWRQKLILQVLLGAAAMWTISHEPLTIAWGTFSILFFSNAYNFSDGIDGLAGSLGLILFGFFALMSLLPGFQWAMVGGFLVFLYWNRFPAKVFMGDVGALPIGAVLGLMMYFIGSTLPTTLSWVGFVAFAFVMIAELVPPPLQVLSVKLTGKRIFPRTPIHHAFQAAGWSELKIVGLFAGVQLAGAAVAYYCFTAS